jgi:two-component system chemotaxis sensor kinase CheA
MNDEDVYKIIFQDNFTTKDALNNISGRGIGMGAVLKEISKLDGVIQIKSKKNLYTKFKFILPYKA